MPQDVLDFTVLMVPDKRNLLTITIRESTGTNDTPVGALHVISCGPAAEVIVRLLHFDFLPPVLPSGVVHCYPHSAR